MKIAQVAPLWERVPPVTYGGVELIVSLLTDELVRRGHDVTLFASGDSVSLAEISSVHSQALRLDHNVHDCSVYEFMHLSHVYENAHEFDIIHSHIGYPALSVAPLVNVPTVHTLHGIFTPDSEKLFAKAHNQPFVSISDAQREPRLGLNYVKTVYNGIDTSSYDFYAQPQEPPYLAFLGRISPEKGTHLAIDIAQQVGLPLKMGAKVDPVDVDYYEREIKPRIDGQHIQYLGEVNHQEKNALLGGAIATLFPITWREPFGLVMAESMASGTPVVAIAKGSTLEVIEHGKTGFLCNSVEDCIEAIAHIPKIDRHYCRQSVERRFSINSMVDGYESVYHQLLAERIGKNGRIRQTASLNSLQTR